MNDQIHIRNAEAAQLARTLSRQTGKTISEVVLDALRVYRPKQRPSASAAKMARWRRLLREDRKNLIEPETPLEALYDERSGLPK